MNGKTKKLSLFCVVFAIVLIPSIMIVKGENETTTISITKTQETGKEPLILGSDDYEWIWETYIGAPGDIYTEDVVFWGPSMGPYHNYTEVMTKVHELELFQPNIVDVFSIGKSHQGRDLWTVRLTNESYKGAKTQYYVVGAHHAREAITVENSLYFMDKLVYEAINSNSEVLDLLNTSL